MKAMFTTRDATLDDVPRLGELFDLYRQFYERAPDRASAEAYIRQRLSSGESHVIVVQTPDSGVVGFCQLYPLFCSLEARPIYSLSDLFVLPGQRRLGLGRALLLAAEQAARAHGKVRMDLTTAKTNRSAQALYESLGWVRDDVFYAYTRTIAA
jgi:ribosomal protein S18 acetylase RimI-like enzyme